MSKDYPEIKPEDFTKLTLDKLPHQEIEMALMVMGGGGVAGTEFKNKLMKAAGWTKPRLSTYAGYPDMAAVAFNKIRVALTQTENPAELLELVRQ